MNEDLIHKVKARANGRGPRSVCGRYGYVAVLWRSVTCAVCLATRKEGKQ